MNDKHKRSLVLASIIGTLLGTYDSDEKTKLHQTIHGRIGKGVRKFASQYGVNEVMRIAHEEGNTIWKDAVDHFAEREITIEASSCILALWNMDEKNLSKHFGLSKGKIGEWAKPSKRADRLALELASREVAKYVFAKTSEVYGIEVENKVSVLERIKLHNRSVA